MRVGFTMHWPDRAQSARLRRPSFVSPSTASVVIEVNADAQPAGPVTFANAPPPLSFSSVCPFTRAHSARISSGVARVLSLCFHGRASAASIGSMRLPIPVVTKPFTSKYMKGSRPSNRAVKEGKAASTLGWIPLT